MAASEAGLTAGMVNTIAQAAGTVRKCNFNDYLLLIICMKLDDVIGGESKSFAKYQESEHFRKSDYGQSSRQYKWNRCDVIVRMTSSYL